MNDDYDYEAEDRMIDLIEDRKELVRDINIIGDMRHQDETARINRTITTGVDPGRAVSAGEQKAIDALAAFDAAHPEVIAKIQADRASRVSRAD